MVVALRFFALLLWFFGVVPFFCAGMEIIQLPSNIVSRMNGEWGIEVQTPCDPYILTGTVSLENGTIEPDWALALRMTSAPAESWLMDASGLRAFAPVGRGRGTVSLSYAICGEQRNTIPTPDRPGFEKKMETTELTEYVGVLSNGEDDTKTCDSAAPNVIIHTLGSDIQGLKETHWKVKESLQYIEFKFNAEELTSHCVDKTGKERTETKNVAREGRGRKRRANILAGDSGTLEGFIDQNVREGAIIIRFVRRSLPAKSFYERYFTSLLFGGIMIAYRVLQGFISYWTIKY
ncbi:uncharacterized protein TM35_000331110 [Trypanosoma theileri]|uniref:Uncharacterized protein n=1 Tax=Trypanosoma theileri TaxID=67003 RepID=A0A1X0NLP1_9TRYP|nr:uncharacterized protein TM35_000331110 [Trypanosoma theileri]ORC85654.1 hypothetical protein TM35_000331110 [Trypanosoma theileri]